MYVITLSSPTTIMSSQNSTELPFNLFTFSFKHIPICCSKPNLSYLFSIPALSQEALARRFPSTNFQISTIFLSDIIF